MRWLRPVWFVSIGAANIFVVSTSSMSWVNLLVGLLCLGIGCFCFYEVGKWERFE